MFPIAHVLTFQNSMFPLFLFLFLFSEQHIYYVFCLLKLDGQVLDTALVETDESETDISFDNIIVL